MNWLLKIITAIENWALDRKLGAMIVPMEPQTTPQPEAQYVPPAQPASVNRFLQFCGFIKTYEGANPANNNPYDFRYYFGGYLPKYGIVKESTGGFAMFESLQIGEEYGQTCIREMILNHPEWNFYDFFNRFAPPSDNNNTSAYAEAGAKYMGVEVTSNLKQTLEL